MKVSEVMKPIMTISEDHTLRDAAKVMSKNNISSVIVSGPSGIDGIITERDVTKQVSENPDSLSHPVKQYMTKELITVEPDTHIEDAASMMIQNKVKKLPVVKDGKVVGILSSTDLVAHCSDFNSFSVFD